MGQGLTVCLFEKKTMGFIERLYIFFPSIQQNEVFYTEEHF